MYERKVLLGFMRVHILYHAASSEGIYGSGIIRELGRHGYRISPGTLYPILHEMEKDGMMWSERVKFGGKIRKVYRATHEGLKVLGILRRFVSELSEEVLV